MPYLPFLRDRSRSLRCLPAAFCALLLTFVLGLPVVEQILNRAVFLAPYAPICATP